MARNISWIERKKLLDELKYVDPTVSVVEDEKGNKVSTKSKSLVTRDVNDLALVRDDILTQKDFRTKFDTQFKTNMPLLKLESKPEDRSGVFAKGAFRDGYQLGDITKSTVSTIGDVAGGLLKGAAQMGEGIYDAGMYFSAGLAENKGDTKLAEERRKKAQKESVNEFFEPYEMAVDKNSLLGEKTDLVTNALGQVGGLIGVGALAAAGAGALGIGAAGAGAVATALTTGTVFTSSTGSGMSEAYAGGATDKEAQQYGLIAGFADAATELLFGGLGKTVKAVGLSKGLSSADDMLAKKISEKISNTVLKNATQLGVKASGEGLEEVLAGAIQAVGQQMTYRSEDDLKQIIEDQDLLEQFIVGAITSGIVQTPSAVKSTKAGRDFITGYTDNEQSVIDSEVSKRMEESQAEMDSKAKEEAIKAEIDKEIARNEAELGTLTEDAKKSIEESVMARADEIEFTQSKLSKKDIAKIEEQVKKDLDAGEISIDTIEDALVGNERAQIKALNEELKTTVGPEQKADIEARIRELETSKNNTMMSMLQKDNLLQNSYREENLRHQAFTYEAKETDSDAKKELAKEFAAKERDNSTKTHNLFEYISKLQDDKGVKFGLTSAKDIDKLNISEEQKELRKKANGYVIYKDGKVDKIMLNTDSKTAVEFTVGHEITHLLEGTEEYKTLQDALKKYATTKGEYDTRLNDIKNLYNGVEGANVENELTSDLVGTYIFNDTDFVNNLSVENPSIFKRIYEEIKHLYKMATAGSTEARQLEKAKKSFEKAYRQNIKANENADVKYHISETFSNEIDKTLNGEMDKSSQVKARDYTPKILVENGVKDLPMLITQRHIKTIVYSEAEAQQLGLKTGDKYHYHGLGKEALIKSIDNMDNPSAIYKQDNSHYLIITEIKNNNGESVVVPVKIDGKGSYNDVYIDENQILSVYGKNNLESYLKRNNFEKIYEKKETALNERVKFPDISSLSQPEKQAASENNITSVEKDVKYSITDNKGRELSKETTTVLNNEGVSSTESGTVTKYSLSSWNNTDKAKISNELVKAGYSDQQVTKWIDDVNGVASIIASDKDRLDYKADENQKMLKDNAEYVKTLDASTLCSKRLLYQGTYNAIQHALPNTPLLDKDVIKIRKLMNEAGYEVPCGICYVESRRKSLGKFAGEWLSGYDANYIPTLDQVTTTDGLESLKQAHPQTYTDFIKAMNKKGVVNPKVVELRTDYRGDIQKLTKKQVEKITRIGGLRVQSFSDFETPHLIDMMQAVLDMSSAGLTAQAYTKVPNFARVFGGTGIKINLSLIGDVDANGNLVFDGKEGMPIDEAIAIKDMYPENVGTILVGKDKNHILAAMSDDRIDFIIPFHRSGWGAADYEQLGLKGYQDFSKEQNEKNLDGTGIKGGNLYPIDYWDYSKSGKENAERYLEICKEQKRIPKFSSFLVNNGDGSWSLQPDGSTDGYWKTLIDFKMYDNNGVGVPQQKVMPNFNMEEARRVLAEYEGGANTLPVAQDIVDKFVSQYSLSDNKGRELSKEQQDYFKDSKVRDENGNLIRLYHGTTEEAFTKFDLRYSENGIFLTDDKDVASGYSGTNFEYAPFNIKTVEQANEYLKYHSVDGYHFEENNGQYQFFYNDSYEPEIESASLEDVVTQSESYTEIQYNDRNYTVYANVVNPLVIDANSSDWENIKFEGKEYTTNEISTIAKERGYDGVIIKNVLDKGFYKPNSQGKLATDVIVFNPNQIKSVNNDVPTDNPDIRYSLSDNQGNKISPTVQKRFENSKVRDENGDLKVVYHGTPSGEFSVFDKAKGSIEGDFGSGFYFTDNESDMEANYEGGGPDFDNKVARRAEQIEFEEDIDYEEAKERAREELYKGDSRFNVYLNIENPAIVGETVLLSQEDYLDNYNIEDFDSEDDYYAEVEQLFADDVESIIYDVENNIDLYSTDGLANVLYEAYYEGGIGVQELKEKINELYLETNDGELAGNEVTRQVIESLGYDGIIDSTVSKKFNMNLSEDTTHYIVFKPNQIKNITNTNPTDNPDINLSLTKSNTNGTRWQDIALKKPNQVVNDDIAPVKPQESVQPTLQTDNTDYAPLNENDLARLEREQYESFINMTDADEPAPKPDSSPDPIYAPDNLPVESPLKDRDWIDVGKRNVKAYQYEHPEVRPYFQEAAAGMYYDLMNSVKGERLYIDTSKESYNPDYTNGYLQVKGVKRQTTDDIADLLDSGYSYADIQKGLDAIIEDNGAENIAVAKRIEFALDERLRKGYKDVYGQPVPADQDYIQLLRDKEVTEYSNSIPIDESLMPPEDTSDNIAYLPKEERRKKHIEAYYKNKEADRVNSLTDADAPVPYVRGQAKENIAPVQNENVETEDIPTKTRKELRKALIEDKTNGEWFKNALDNAKNLAMFKLNNTDTIRVTERVFGRENGRKINDIIFQKAIDNEADSIKWQNTQRDKVRALKIKAGTKESAAVQKYGEKQWVDENGDVKPYGDAELAREFPDAVQRRNIINAAKEIRNLYDEYIDTANGVLTKLGFDPIPKRADYMRHFQELNDAFSRFGIPFNANALDEHTLPTDINGITDTFTPQKNYFASLRPRMGVKTDYDAIKGVDGYIGGIANLIFHTEDIQRGRAFEDLIRETYGEDKGWDNLENLPKEEQQRRAEQIQSNHLSNYVAWLHEWTNNVAGKKSKVDRSIESMFGRKAFAVLDEARKQVGSNMIGFNLSSALTNFIAPVQAAAKTQKLALAKGTADTVLNIFKKDDFASKNKFLTSRMGSDMLAQTNWQKIQNAGFIFMKGADWFTSNQIVRSKYYELRSKGMSEAQAHDEAGRFAARIMGDRTKGANAQLYNSKMLGMVTQFQLEVNNQLYSMFYDTYHESKEAAQGNVAKTAAGMLFTLGQLAAYSHVFNMTFEAIAGYQPALDVIAMIAAAFGLDDDEESEDTVKENLQQAAKKLVDGLPYVNILSGGGRIPVTQGIPNLVKVATGGKDDYGNEVTLKDELKKLPYLLLPTGGNQIKKTYQGLSMFDEDLPVKGSYTDSGNLRFPIEDTVGNRIQASLFGQWANSNARQYFDTKQKPLQEKQIEEFAELDMPIADYWKYRKGLSEQDTIADKFDYVNSLDVTTEQKNIMINNIVDREKSVDMSNYDDFGSYEEFDYAIKNPEKYEFFKENGISYRDYAASTESKEAYNWAFNNPDKYEVSKAVTNDYMTYRQYYKDLNDLTADKDENGKSISGSRKEKVINYVDSLDIDYGAKLILYKTEYENDKSVNSEIINYLNSREDIDYNEMVTILEGLGMKVDANGNVTQ